MAHSTELIYALTLSEVKTLEPGKTIALPFAGVPFDKTTNAICQNVKPSKKQELLKSQQQYSQSL